MAGEGNKNFLCRSFKNLVDKSGLMRSKSRPPCNIALIAWGLLFQRHPYYHRPRNARNKKRLFFKGEKMNLSDYQLFINGQPIKKAEVFQDTRSKNQKRKDRKEYFKNKRKMRGSLSFTIEKEKPWHERIIIKK